jgi:L-2-hydroxyglutarate oxidase
MDYDIVIVGGGIVGLSAALALRGRYPAGRMAVLEKEPVWARHQTGRNSGVIHSGIYYKPGSLKATMARSGAESMVRFCETHGIAHEVCGKLIVAAAERELPALEHLYERGNANGIRVSRISAAQLREMEPAAAGAAALHVADTGIVDYGQVSRTIAGLLAADDVDLRLGTRVVAIRQDTRGLAVETSEGTVKAKFLVNCAGLHCDRVASMCGVQVPIRIVPFRGEYFTLKPERQHVVRNLIYPVPDPNLPFLGVHLTRTISGHVHAGPNAVLGAKREGYRRSEWSARDLADLSLYAGFWRLAARYWRVGLSEAYRSASKAAFTRSLQRLVPEIRSDDLVPAEPGVRAQAVTGEGKLLDDFLIVDGPSSMHVCNAPSPAATASLEIGGYLANRIIDRIDN